MMLALVAGMAVTACDRFKQESSDGDIGTWTPERITEALGIPVAQVRTAVTTRLQGERPAPITEDQWKHVQTLYKRFNAGPLWLDDKGLKNERAGSLIQALINAESDALRPDAYPLESLGNALLAINGEGTTPTAEQLAEADVLLTSAYAALGEDYLTGQVDPKSVAQSWHIDRKEERVDSALARTLTFEPLERAMGLMRPQGEDYEVLRRELVRYRQVAAQGGWPAVSAGKALKPGQTDSPARLQALRARLAAEGIGASTDASANPVRDSSAGIATGTPGVSQQGQGMPQGAQGTTPRGRDSQATARAVGPIGTVPEPGQGGTATARRAAPARVAGANVYDAALARLVAEYQGRHGMPANGVLNAETVESMNVPVQFRLGQIAANMERLRWLPRSLGQRYIYVNVPAFRVEAYDGGQKALEMKVIVGAEYEGRATPVFADTMRYVVFRPYWNVTPDIQRKELEPKIAANPGYMAQHNYEWWTDGGVRRIRQKPGDKNSLGLVKFMFPNDFNIYLHDTPQDELFKKDVRALSHGCIRLEKPDQMAQFVLGWDAGKVQEAMMSAQDNRTVNLPKPIPVYIVYGTAYARDGQLRFGPDVYDRDDALVKATTAGAVSNPNVLRALAALKQIAAR